MTFRYKNLTVVLDSNRWYSITPVALQKKSFGATGTWITPAHNNNVKFLQAAKINHMKCRWKVYLIRKKNEVHVPLALNLLRSQTKSRLLFISRLALVRRTLISNDYNPLRVGLKALKKCQLAIKLQDAGFHISVNCDTEHRV